MNSQGPPLHYPNSHESTAEIYRPRPDELYSPTLCEEYPLPPYADENSPQYQDKVAADQQARAKRVRQVLIVRVMTSIFIALIVSLIVAGAVTKIQRVKNKERSEDTSDLDDTMTAATAYLDLEAETFTTTFTATGAPSSADEATISAEYMTFDCQCWTEAPDANQGIARSTPAVSTCNPSARGDDGASGEDFFLGVSRFSSSDCRLARASFKGVGDDVRYRCSLSCRDGSYGSEDIDEILAGIWKPDYE